MIQLSNVTKRYGPVVAVDDLSFEVRAGEVTGFLGPNGAGKSTTMRMMVGLDAPTSGRVTIDGRPYQDLRFPLRHVGALLEAKAIHPSTDLLLTGLVDSLGVVQIVGWLEDRLDISIDPADVTLDHFQTVARIVRYVSTNHGELV